MNKTTLIIIIIGIITTAGIFSTLLLTKNNEPEFYISCGCGCCSFQEPLEEIGSPEELAMVEDQRRAVERAVEQLRSRDRELYRRRFEQEQSYKVIAEAMGVTVNNVGVALKRLEKRLMGLVGAPAHPPRWARLREGVRSLRPGSSGG